MRYALNTVAINGNQRLYGTGTASIAVGARGYQNKQKYGVSTAALSEILAAATTKKALTAKSTATIAVYATGSLAPGVRGASDPIVIGVEAHHGIPDSTVIPDIVGAAHGSRIVVVQAMDRKFDVYAESPFP